MNLPGAVYQIRVRGHLDPHWVTWLDCERLEHDSDGTTVLETGRIDQSRLHGILGRLRDTGPPLVSVQVRDDSSAPPR